MSDKFTPMMRQYRRIKSEIDPDVILMFRLGDFYELFFEDAKYAAPILNVALTKRSGYPMCGVPHHAMDSYLGKLIRAGCKVAICEQMEDPAAAKGIVRREITRIITPGTITEEGALEDERNNYIAAISHFPGKGFGLAALELSTGELIVENHENIASLIDAIYRIAPCEGIVPISEDSPDEERKQTDIFKQSGVNCVTPVDGWFYEESFAYTTLTNHFTVASLEGFGCEGNSAVIRAAGAILYHVKENLRRDLSHVTAMRLGQTSGYMTLDDATCGHLDLLPMAGRNKAHTLYGVLNATRTPMGARLLHRWVARPLLNLETINNRHDAVEILTKTRSILTPIRDLLAEVRDLERTIARVSLGRGSPRDINAISNALKIAPEIRERLEPAAKGEVLEKILNGLLPLNELTDTIDKTLVESPPATMNEGGMIRTGVNTELDELKDAAANGRAWIAKYQADEIKRTGIKTLKVKFNKIFGYFIEVSSGQLANVPEEYVRKQTMVNCERFITPELKEREEKIIGAADRSIILENEIFDALREKVVSETAAIQAVASAIAELDALCSLADRALALDYTRPAMDESDTIRITDSRHPVIEQLPDSERFVPNDVELNCSTRQIMVITGPNMAGKSTYIRQVALLVVMAQMGSFVPAKTASIGIVDRVFTRVGASDDLAKGRSTFMVEMEETANILNNATTRSLIVLDEIGRGTSTFDGISIAWAVAEYLHNTPAVKAKTLFATHYHELTDLSLTLNGVVNCNVLVRERGDSVVFLRRIVDGTADKSYGIAVAKLAGMPETVLHRAREILENLEADELSESGISALIEPRSKPKRERYEDERQLTFF
jgi:DNA mismatch repair protein MutS